MPRPLYVAPGNTPHAENFPVASWLCPPRLRPPIGAIYRFARCADDLADEGDASAPERLAALDAYAADLRAIAAGAAPSARWPEVFGPLALQMQAFALPLQPLQDLLSAFNGMSAAGLWTLTVIDDAGADVGSLRGWELSLGGSAVPEPATWAMMIIGFGAAGSMVRASRRKGVAAAA